MRRKFHSLTFVFMALLMMLMTFASCSKIQDLLNEGDDDDDDDGGINPPELVEGRMEDIALSGIVRDASGTPIEGVSIVSGSSAATTNTDGFFEFDQIQVVSVLNDRSVVRFSKAGYFDVVRSMDADDDAADGASWEVVMCKKENNDFTSIKTYSSSSDQTLQAGEMKIDMPQDGYKVDGTGLSYTGKVKSEMVYLDPNNERFSEMMPGGDLAAVRSDNSSAQLVSYGMTDLNMYAENGDKLQLKDGCKAKLTFPIPAGMGENPPASIPLWSFNEKTGLWEEEGSAALQGNVYVGEVAHFSWVNLDYPEKQGTVYGYVKDDTGKVLPGVRLSIGQLLAPTVTNSDGYYSHEVPANTAFSITVKAQYYGGISQMAFVNVAALSPGESRRVDITLSHMVRVYGRVMNEKEEGIRSTVWVQTDKDKSELCQTDKEGNFNVYVPKDMKGNATVCARTFRGEEVSKEITIHNEDVPVDLIIGNAGGGSSANMIYIFSEILDDAVWPIPTYTSMKSGVIIVDDTLSLMPDEDAAIGLNIAIPHYEREKNTYQDGVLVYAENLGTRHRFVTAPGKKMKCTVQRNGGNFVFSLEGYGSYVNDSTEEGDENAKLIGKDMSYPLLAAFKSLRNIKPVDAGFPSFTPQLEAKAPFALLFTECGKFSKGGEIFYNGGSSDYQTLKNAAAKQGFTNLGEDNDEKEGTMAVYFYSAKKKGFVLLEYNPKASGITGKTCWTNAEEQAPIYMMVLEGVTEDMLQSMFTDDTRSTRVTARRHLNPISKCKFDGFKKKKMFKKLARLR
ncbi:carboxypeptidase-like regulatory domain-containing protein [Segatella copri]|uniref:carboxypeptidase-like regulatory domain-containing protein n=1 Tax=Segatella copri TaxID=165179 RepID=UPI003F94C79D